MDGVHDLGGLHGFGPVDPGGDHRLDPADWRSRMVGIELSYTQPGGFNLAWLRHAMECMPPAAYLASEYHERWYWRDAAILANAGWVTLAELGSGRSEDAPPVSQPPLSPEAAERILQEGVDSRRAPLGEARFRPGDGIRTRFHGPLGATRLPRYLRGHGGRVEQLRGWYPLADAQARGIERIEPLYGVSFRAGELWEDAPSPEDRVCADLWESYLEPT